MKMHLDEVNPRALLSTLTSTSPPWGFRSLALRHLCHSANGDFTIINNCHCTLMMCDRHNQRTHLRRIRYHALIDQVRASLSNTGHLRSAGSDKLSETSRKCGKSAIARDLTLINIKDHLDAACNLTNYKKSELINLVSVLTRLEGFSHRSS